MAYRDIFNGTKLAEDSASVAEFNKIAASLRGYKDSDPSWDAIQIIEQNLIEQDISTKDLSRIVANRFYLLILISVFNFSMMLMIGLIENSLLKKEL